MMGDPCSSLHNWKCPERKCGKIAAGDSRPGALVLAVEEFWWNCVALDASPVFGNTPDPAAQHTEQFILSGARRRRCLKEQDGACPRRQSCRRR